MFGLGFGIVGAILNEHLLPDIPLMLIEQEYDASVLIGGLLGTAQNWPAVDQPFASSYAPSHIPLASAQPSTTIERPVRLIDLLKNFRTAVVQGALLNEGFYVAPVLTKYFGGTDLKMYVRDPEKALSGDLMIFGPLTRPVELPNGKTIAGMGLNFDWERKSDASVVATLNIMFRADTDVSFADVESIFGTDWEYDRTIPSPHKTFQPRTRPHGNTTIVYEYVKGRVHQTLKAEFAHDATLMRLEVLSKETP